MIFSRFNRPKVMFSYSGDGTAPVYEERLNRGGVLALIRTGKRDLVEFINASLESTNIYNILDRFNAGDYSVLQKRKGFYADVSTMPKSLVEVHNFMRSLRSDFENLDPKIKEKFGNSPDKFIESVENGDFIKLFGKSAQNSPLSSGAAGLSSGDDSCKNV